MKSLKTVLLGTAAGLLATGVAQAADLPVKKAAAVQYVEVCPVYGAGFYKLPGTDICIRHFGSMKFNYGIQDARTAFFADSTGKFALSSSSGKIKFSPASAFATHAGAANTMGWQWTIRPGWDFRSPTEYGTLRTVVQLRVDQRNGIFENDDPVGTGAMRLTNAVHRGYIEWAGFIVGRAGSSFPYWDQEDVVVAIGGDPKATAMQLTYVFNIPGGIKATIGVEDTTPWTAGDGITDLAHPAAGRGISIVGGPTRGYDYVASLSTDQSWGTAKLSAAAHQLVAAAQVNGNGGSVTGLRGPNTFEQDYGFAALAGVTFFLPMLGAKDQLLLQTTWCKGASAYCGTNGGADNNATTFERGGQFLEGLQRNDVDAYANTTSTTSWSYDKVKIMSVAGQLRHYWAPLWRSNLSASYRKIDVPTSAEQWNFRQGGLGDAKVSDIALNLIWGQKQKTAEIGVEALYKSTKQDIPGNPSQLGGGSAAGNDVLRRYGPDTSGWAVVGFLQRNW